MRTFLRERSLEYRINGFMGRYPNGFHAAFPTTTNVLLASCTINLISFGMVVECSSSSAAFAARLFSSERVGSLLFAIVLVVYDFPHLLLQTVILVLPVARAFLKF